MNRTLRAVAVALALVSVTATAGCAQFGNLFQTEEVSTYDEKALISVEKLYGYTLDQVKTAAPLLTVNQATQAQQLLVKAKEAVDDARRLYDRNADAEASPKTAEALSAVQAVIDLLVSAGVLK